MGGVPARSKPMFPALVGLAVLVAAGLAWRFAGQHHTYVVEGQAESHGEWVDAALTTTQLRVSGIPDGSAHPSPHAVHDPAKRQEILRLLLQAQAAPDPTATANPATARGNRDTDSVEEFGAWVSEAIREDFVPMARECAKDLAARVPDAGGSVRVEFELLGDTKIGGVVNSADVADERSTLHDDKFAECMRESMYGVYFDPPPAGGRATLNFDVNVKGDGTIDEQVDDFHPVDKRNLPPSAPVR